MTTAIRRAFSEHNGNRSGCRLGGIKEQLDRASKYLRPWLRD